MDENKIKPFKLRRAVVVGDRPIGATISWRTLLAFCTTVVIIVLGIVGWFYPWLRLPEAYIVVVILVSWALVLLYRSHQK